MSTMPSRKEAPQEPSEPPTKSYYDFAEAEDRCFWKWQEMRKRHPDLSPLELMHKMFPG